MKVNKIMAIRLLLVLAMMASFSSCSKKSDSKAGSRATGWKINDKKGGFQYASKFKKQETGPGLVLVEGGTFTMGKVADDVMHDWNNTPNQQHVMSFYMDETEVTNMMYMEYLNWLKNVFPPTEENYKQIYEGALPDTLVWRNRLGYSENMTNNYLRHPAYASYPVVGVNWIQANEFSKWRTDRVNEALLEKNGFLKKDAKTLDVTAENSFNTETYFNSPSSTYGGDEKIVLKGRKGSAAKGTKTGKDGKVIQPKNIYVQRSSGLLLPEYRLPTESEWEYAAAADIGQREYNVYKGQKKYPWSGSYTRSGKRQTKGDQLANFKQGKGDYGGIAGWSDDGADITNKVKSYPPNDFGLYDMAGNVAEWVADVYRPIIDDEMNDISYYRGNQYFNPSIGEDGKVLITKNTDSISTQNLPGSIQYGDSNSVDLRNFNDGDLKSTREFLSSSGISQMYNSPDLNDPNSESTTLISDKARVYKGGSWLDRAYYLDPAQRRYQLESMTSNFIGFRCAMSYLGEVRNTKKSRKR